jgi:hypothetical protein
MRMFEPTKEVTEAREKYIIESFMVGYEVLTPVVMKSSIFSDIMQCSALKLSGHFGGICRIHLQCGRISQARTITKKVTRLTESDG